MIDKFRKTFDTYWEDKELEHYNAGSDRQKLSRALAERPGQDHSRVVSFFDNTPYPYQSEVLSRLTSEREIHNRFRNLIVAAAGTGKTIISAFDFKRFREHKPDAKLHICLII